MTIFHLTDLHGRLGHLESVHAAMEAADVVVVSGDITNFGGRGEAEQILDRLAEINPKILAVAGNCDRRSVDAYLSERGLNLHAQLREMEGRWFAGLGGSLSGPAPTPNTYTEGELRGALGRLMSSTGTFVLVSHQPPFDTVADRIASERHVGSRAVREYIESSRPLLCLTGHIHEAVGHQELFGCHVVNPGPFSQGRYGVIEIRPSSEVRVELFGD